MNFLRTASTRRLLATILAAVAVVAAGTAIAVAATGSGPVPKPKPLSRAVHSALTAASPKGITADIHFTNNLISSADFTGETADPILQGATGRLWLSPGTGLRLELQSNDGDSQVVVNKTSFWVSDPASKTVYEGRLPAGKDTSKAGAKADEIPTVAQIQSDLNHLMANLNLAGAGTSNPTDVGGRPAYSVKISPRHDGGQLGSAQLAWDAITGVPLDIAVYARANSTPVLELKVTNISYGAVPASDLTVSPPAGDKVVKVATPSSSTAKSGAATRSAHKHADVHGVSAVSAKLPFKLTAPASLDGLPRHSVSLLDWGGEPAALVTYGQNLGGIAVIEQGAKAGTAAANSGSRGNLALPTVSIDGATGQELDTALGSMVRFSHGAVAYTVIGSVAPYAADRAARSLAASGAP